MVDAITSNNATSEVIVLGGFKVYIKDCLGPFKRDAQRGGADIFAIINDITNIMNPYSEKPEDIISRISLDILKQIHN